MTALYRVTTRPPGLTPVHHAPGRNSVFVDGCFWHGCPEHKTAPAANGAWWAAKLARNVERDRETDAHLRSLGWTVLRFWEHEDMEHAATDIEGIISGGRFCGAEVSSPDRTR